MAVLLAVLFALAPPAAMQMNARARASHQAAVKQARLAYGFVPAPPVVHYVQGYAPGITQETAAGNAAYDATTDTVYYQGKLGKPEKAHEVGHAFADQVLSDGDERYFTRIMGLPAGVWHQGSGIQGLRSPSEWFADYYQAAAMNIDPRYERFASYAQVGPLRLKWFEKALARLAKRRGITAQYT